VPGRIVLLHTSPRLPAGLLTARAWDLVRAAPVYSGAETPQLAALAEAGARVTVVPENPVETLLADPAPTVVWLAAADGEPALARALSRRLVGMSDRGPESPPGRRAGESGPRQPTLEAEYGSWDPPGARLLDVVAVMDRLRTDCPWDREQTHASLAPYLLEEAYEAVDAVDSGDLSHLREELGDVLLQVVFHARLATDEEPAFDVDDVAADLVAKLVRRHPHVFADVSVSGADEVHTNWEQIKRAEKARESAMDGVPLNQPALALAAKLQSRAERAGVAVDPPVPAGADGELGGALLTLVADARARGLDPEAALRRAALAYAEAVRAAERG
jgi:NTP pyrophosphatase (non-canonical NTP hydrolase)